MARGRKHTICEALLLQCARGNVQIDLSSGLRPYVIAVLQYLFVDAIDGLPYKHGIKRFLSEHELCCYIRILISNAKIHLQGQTNKLGVFFIPTFIQMMILVVILQRM